MKKLLFAAIVACAIPFTSGAQHSNTTISGTVANPNVKYIYVEFPKVGSQTVDSIAVNNGTFEKSYAADSAIKVFASLERPLSLLYQMQMEGKQVDTSPFYPVIGNSESAAQSKLRPILCEMMIIAKEHKLLMFLNPGEKVNLSIPKEGLSKVDVGSNPSIAAYAKFLRTIEPIEEQEAALEKEFKTYEGKVDVAVIATFDDKLTDLMQKKRLEAFQYIKANPTSPYVPTVLLAHINPDMKLFTELSKLIDKSVWATREGKELKRILMRYSKTPEGTPAYDFTALDSNGNPVTLSKVKGKVILVEFWASWCTPCRAENPYLSYMHERYKDKGFTLISFSLDNKKPEWIRASEKDGISWINVSDLEGIKSTIASEFGVRGVPANYLICDGKIIAVNLRRQLLNEKLRELLK